jgi:MerR family transcriptional regulator, redox-sensitive transcriptional activator SoxR
MEHAGELLAIGEVARRAGLRTSAIRYYEQEGLLPEPRRDGGRRRYGEEVLLRLALIGAAQGVGFTVAEMRTLFEGLAPDAVPRGRWRPLAERKIAEADALIARAMGMKRLLEASLRCGCVRLEDCVLLREAGG